MFQKAQICCYLPYLSACGPPKTSPDPSPGLRAAQEGLQEPQEGLEELIFDEISVIGSRRAIWAAEHLWAGDLVRGKTLGGLFGLQKNLGGRYFGRRKIMRTRTLGKFGIRVLYF